MAAVWTVWSCGSCGRHRAGKGWSGVSTRPLPLPGRSGGWSRFPSPRAHPPQPLSCFQCLWVSSLFVFLPLVPHLWLLSVCRYLVEEMKKREGFELVMEVQHSLCFFCIPFPSQPIPRAKLCWRKSPSTAHTFPSLIFLAWVPQRVFLVRAPQPAGEAGESVLQWKAGWGRLSQALVNPVSGTDTAGVFLPPAGHEWHGRSLCTSGGMVNWKTPTTTLSSFLWG